MNKLPTLTVSCKNCIFSVWNETGKTQTGCELGKLENLKQYVVEAYDEEKEFYIVQGRLCYYKRNSTWSDAVKLAGEDIYDRVNRETLINYMGVVLTNRTTTKEELGKTLDSLFGQSIRPTYITVCVEKEGILNQFNTSKLLKNRGIEWQVQLAKDDYTKEFAVDLAIDSNKRPFYVVIETPHSLYKEKSLEWQKLLVDGATRAIVIKGDSYKLFSTSAHNYFSGNAFNVSLEEKIIKEGFGDLIISDIVPKI